MSEIVTVGLELAKNLFQFHGADGERNAGLRKKLGMAQVLEFFARLPPCPVAMEVCGGAHFPGRGGAGAHCDLPPDIRAIANWNFPPLNG
ncbi:hypothetical protein JMM61_13310 [Rhodovulum sulfidophilum]|nr:hypothetical protein [Rhodovulum sulfidophilum]